MIHRIESMLRQARRVLSRDEWSWRLLRLQPARKDEGRRGLLMIQIDGLSRSQLEKAIRQGRMPFLRGLLKRESYRLNSLYSGLPSTTPAAQGELFYRRKCCVPAFAYRDSRDGRVMTLLNPESAKRIENELEAEGEPLLKGGSAYSDIYSGGADESHFCASGLSPTSVLRSANPLAVLLILIWNFPSVIRLMALLGIESFLAFYDALRGAVAKGEFWHEFKFIFSRVLVCVGLREVITAMASMDLMRGLPVVQLNFAGYDEQSHRRGPSSAFAHFSLRGIDGSIRRLYRAAHRSYARDYEVWIYSDHGQEATQPYLKETGRTLAVAVRDCLGPTLTEDKGRALKPRKIVRSQVPMGARLEKSILKARSKNPLNESPSTSSGELLVLGYGPVAHIYLPSPCRPELLDRMAGTLQKQAAIPALLFRLPDGRVKVYSAHGVFHLPENAAEILGSKHLCAPMCAQDLVELCHHPHAGDFVALGWRNHGKPLTFAWENGAHGGPGSEETHAFAILPSSIQSRAKPDILRHSDLHDMALKVRNAPARRGAFAGAFKPKDPHATLRVLTYNVHACAGMDGKVNPARIARVIAQMHADVICLQECYGSERGDLTLAVATALEQEFHLEPVHIAQDRYGNAILTHWPMKTVQQAALPTASGYTLEERGAQWVEVLWQDLPMQILNTHLGLLGEERFAQAETLIGSDWLQAALAAGPTLLAGDFNAGPRSSAFKLIDQLLPDAQNALSGHHPRNTFFGRFPVHRIDHVFLSPALKVVYADVPRTHLTRLASDHLPLLVEVALI